MNKYALLGVALLVGCGSSPDFDEVASTSSAVTMCPSFWSCPNPPPPDTSFNLTISLTTTSVTCFDRSQAYTSPSGQPTSFNHLTTCTCYAAGHSQPGSYYASYVVCQ